MTSPGATINNASVLGVDDVAAEAGAGASILRLLQIRIATFKI